MGDLKRVWCDGCYDLVHFGHVNSLLQAKAHGDYLVVGVHSDAEISKQKGAPVFTLEERCKMMRAVKWVDEVVEGAPYVTNIETLDKYKCDFCCHGDDLTTTAEGVDTYHLVKEAKRYIEVKRTSGVSTTDVVSRMLTQNFQGSTTKQDKTAKLLLSDSSKFIATPHEIQLFECGDEVLEVTSYKVRSDSNDDPKKIVYASGAFDLFHVGHLDFLEKAAALGDYVIVGLHEDSEVNRYKGKNYPIMNIYERAFSVLACKYVSEVVINAPFSISEQFMSEFNIDLVCHGDIRVEMDTNGNDPYKVPKDKNAFILLDSQNPITTEDIVDRVICNRKEFEERNRKKEAKEAKEIIYLEELSKMTVNC